MRPNYISDEVPGVLNLTMLEENVSSQPAISQPKGYEAAIFSAIMELKEDFKSFKNEIKSELKELSARIENTNLYVATLDTQVNKYHCDVVGKTCNASPTKPKWRPWFPLQTVTDVNTMEQNLQDENCRADVVSFLQRTPTGKIGDRTKYCLSRMISDELSKNLSWLKTPNRQSFGSTTLWAIILETLSGTSNDPDSSAIAIRRTCIAWFQNARDRSGGRSKRRFTEPHMPLLENSTQNIRDNIENVPPNDSRMNLCE
ncbi:unnamed protein product [Calicophoron daubneyi]|uniref:DUF4806 domain-containing protein n=1 Tax=Calicophoron daubneyi TaxID=300641 RepID=A0AAV2T800_CALDB